MNLVRFRPFNEFNSVFDRFFDDTLWALTREPAEDPGRSWTPAVDARETEEGLCFELDIPGFAKDEITISFQDGLLTISAERPRGEQNYLRKERWTGKVLRSFRLPNSVDPEKISASLKHGVLTLTVPKKKEARRRETPVQVN